MIGCCTPQKLCPLHLDGMFMQLKGTAATRGELWAEDVRTRRPSTEEWPDTDRMRAIARRKVADLASDPALLEQLAAELATWAARRWTRGR